MSTVVDEIKALAPMKVPELVERYTELMGKKPRRHFAQYLRKRIAFAIQEKEYGGLSSLARKRIAELAAEIKLPLDDEKPSTARRYALSPGTVLTREWKGKPEHVLVREDGFEWEERVFKVSVRSPHLPPPDPLSDHSTSNPPHGGDRWQDVRRPKRAPPRCVACSRISIEVISRRRSSASVAASAARS
jgi:hypothetical protein